MTPRASRPPPSCAPSPAPSRAASPAPRPLCPRETARAPFMPYGALLFTSARRFQRSLLPSRPAKLPRLGSAPRPPRIPSLARALLCAGPQTGPAEEGSNPGPGPRGTCPTGQPARKHLARPGFQCLPSLRARLRTVGMALVPRPLSHADGKRGPGGTNMPTWGVAAPAASNKLP